MNRIDEWEAEFKRLNAQAAPIVNTPVALASLDANLSQREEGTIAGVANDAQPILSEIIEEYIRGDDTLRKAIRNLFAKYDSLAWAAHYKMKDSSSAEVKRYVASLSIEDQGKDTRDYLMSCSAIFTNLQTKGIPYKKELREVVAISAKNDKYGMGSTVQILSEWC